MTWGPALLSSYEEGTNLQIPKPKPYFLCSLTFSGTIQHCVRNTEQILYQGTRANGVQAEGDGGVYGGGSVPVEMLYDQRRGESDGAFRGVLVIDGIPGKPGDYCTGHDTSRWRKRSRYAGRGGSLSRDGRTGNDNVFSNEHA